MKKKEGMYITSTPKRSFIKAVMWETIGFVITVIAVYIIYGNIKMSITFSLGLTLIKIIFLYAYERAWKKILWGKVYAKKDSCI